MTPWKIWHGTPPTVCDLCNGPLGDLFFDASTRPTGSWAVLCGDCFRTHGVGLGHGVGQAYRRLPRLSRVGTQPSTTWVSVEPYREKTDGR